MLPDEYIQRLQNTPQNPKYHAEGNAWIHTQMVLAEYQKHAASHDLTENEKTIFYWACLLHDIGKPEVTVWRNEKWTSRGHESAGVPIARKILHQQAGISVEQRHQILDLVRWHHVPLKWMDEQKSLLDFQRLATRTDLRMIGKMAIFDLEGRICENKEGVRNCYTRFNEEIIPKIENLTGDFHSINSRYRAASRSHQNALWNAYNMQNPVLWEKLLSRPSPPDEKATFHCIISVGAPRCGKTTWLRENYPYALHLSTSGWDLDGKLLDDLYDRQRVLTTFNHHIASYYSQHRTIVLDGNNLCPETRHTIVSLVRHLQAKVTMVFFDTSWEDVLARNVQNENPLSVAELQEKYNYLRNPHPWEAHEMRVV